MNYAIESFKKWCKESSWVKVVWSSGSVMIGERGHFHMFWRNDNTSFQDIYTMMEYAKSVGARVYEY